MTTPDESSALGYLRRALAALSRAGTARVELRDEVPVKGRADLFTAMEGIGIVDFVGSRSAIDYGAYAEVFDRGRRRSGASGVELSELGEPATELSWGPLLLVALTEAATSATYGGTETVRGTNCQLLHVVADASSLVGSSPSISPAWFSDPDSTPLDACIAADGTLRRLRWSPSYPGDGTTVVLDFAEFGVELDFDWTRLPLVKPLDRESWTLTQTRREIRARPLHPLRRGRISTPRSRRQCERP
jgi:hypothetical protein